MLQRKDIFVGKRVNTPFGLGMITVMPYNDQTDTVFVELDRPTFDYFPKDTPQRIIVVSFKMMSEPNYAPVPDKIKNNKLFRYKVYRFIPAGPFADFGIKDDFKEISCKIETDNILAIWKRNSRNSNRPEDIPRFEWCHKDFYDMTEAKEDDVFYCIETGKFYVPGENELFALNSKCAEYWLNN